MSTLFGFAYHNGGATHNIWSKSCDNYGGNSGIGRATAVALAKEGVKVVIAARREKEGEETVQLVKDAGSDGVFVKTDVTNEDDIKALVDRTVQVYGKLDYALN